MNSVFFLFMRRMRTPLILLVCVYAFSVIGFVLIPGIDDQGQSWRMGFFHAFYFVSFMGSTIGFGEIPYPFTDAQRLWTIITIYTTVITWLYAIGSLLSLVQDPLFRRFVKERSFIRSVRRIKEPYYLICGYGDSGSILVDALASRGIRSVVVDIQQDRIDLLETESLNVYVPGLCADAADPSNLILAGIKYDWCVSVIALTNSDQTNLAIALATKLLNTTARAICRADYSETEANLESFGTDFIINSFETFSDRLAMAIHSPAMYIIYDWMTSAHGVPLAETVTPPSGTWILCGYGRFGKALEKHLAFEGIKTRIIESLPDIVGAPANTIIGRGTEAPTLLEAGIETANGIVAGTDNGPNNLSIILTAKEINPKIFTVARQNQKRNDPIFKAADIDLVMQPGMIIAREILALIKNPLLADFLKLARAQDNVWAEHLINLIRELVNERPPELWVTAITTNNAPAVVELVAKGDSVQVIDLYKDPTCPDRQLDCLPLFLKRGKEMQLMPEPDMPVHYGDRLLFAGLDEAEKQMQWIANNWNTLNYVKSGIEPATGLLWRWIRKTGYRNSV